MNIEPCCCYQGKIASSAVLSNLYAMGVTECDNMLMHVGVSQKMSDKERDAVLPLLATGFKVCLIVCLSVDRGIVLSVQDMLAICFVFFSV